MTSVHTAAPGRHRVVTPRRHRRAWAVGLGFGLALASTQADAFWTARATAGSAGGAAAATVPAAPAPGVVVRPPSELRPSWGEVVLSDGTPATGYTVSRVDPSGLATAATGGCAGVVTSTSCTEASVPDGLWTYRVTARYGGWSGPQGPASEVVRTDATAPTNGLSLLSESGGSFLDGSTLWFRGRQAGSLRIVNAVADPGGSGPASSTTAIGGRGSREWRHTTATVTTPVDGPFESPSLSWSATADTDLHVDVTGADTYGNRTTTRLTARSDTAGPTGGALGFPDGITSSTTVTGTVAAAGDAGSGVGRRVLQASYAGLQGNTCGPFSDWFDAIESPPATISYQVPAGLCYRGRHVMVDRVGNTTVVESPSVLKVRDRDYASRVTATPGLVGYWRLGEASGTTLTAVRGPAGTYQGGPALGVAGAIAGETDTAVSFDGRDDHGRVPRIVAGSFSLEFWFNGRGTGGGNQWWAGAGMVDAELPYNTDDLGVALMGDGRVAAGVGNPDVTAMSAPGYSDGRWHHVVMTRDQGSGLVELYVDGTRVATTTGGTQLLDEPQHLDIGRTLAGAAYFTGSIDEVAVYDRVVPAGTVGEHYRAGLP